MDRKQQAQELIDKYLSGQCTQQEKALFESWYTQLTRQQLDLSVEPDYRLRLEQLINGLSHQKPISKRVVSLRWTAAAASILLILSVGGYLIWHKQTQQQVAQDQIHDIAPGGNKAILTLANGKQIVLTGAKNGNIANENKTAINKTADGEVTYVKGFNNDAALAYNTMTTPRGGKYTLTLSDGTMAILDAASSITYPVAFTGRERKVEITGQVYFEVVHNSKKPFIVSVKGQTIEDLGTHFNINAYDDEPSFKTTLLEGSVSVALNNQKKVLKPGQQALVKNGDNKIIIQQADTEEAIAWKNGQFRFNDEQLGSIMRQVARWYDVDIAFEDERLKEKSFAGVTTRFGKVSQLLHMLELTGEAKFKIEGKKILVLNK